MLQDGRQWIKIFSHVVFWSTTLHCRIWRESTAVYILTKVHSSEVTWVNFRHSKFKQKFELMRTIYLSSKPVSSNSSQINNRIYLLIHNHLTSQCWTNEYVMVTQHIASCCNSDLIFLTIVFPSKCKIAFGRHQDQSITQTSFQIEEISIYWSNYGWKNRSSCSYWRRQLPLGRLWVVSICWTDRDNDPSKG